MNREQVNILEKIREDFLHKTFCFDQPIADYHLSSIESRLIAVEGSTLIFEDLETHTVRTVIMSKYVKPEDFYDELEACLIPDESKGRKIGDYIVFKSRSDSEEIYESCVIMPKSNSVLPIQSDFDFIECKGYLSIKKLTLGSFYFKKEVNGKIKRTRIKKLQLNGKLLFVSVPEDSDELRILDLDDLPSREVYLDMNSFNPEDDLAFNAELLLEKIQKYDEISLFRKVF